MSIDLIQGEQGLELFHKDGNWVLLSDVGYSPVQLLASSIAACGAYVFKSVLEKSSIPFEFVGVNVDYDRNLDHKSKPIKDVVVVFKMRIPDEYHDRATRSLRLVNDFCPVIMSLDPNIDITKQIEFIK